MKKLVLILTLVCICAFAAPAFANPFSDVAADHWAYDAIDKLADDGIVVGNPDGTYKGNKTMTRYEMATLVARAMAASEADDAKISAENKALIDKLAAEFGSELDALGVRVTALENKVGNVKLTGTAQIRMVDQDYDDLNGKNDKNKYQMRFRLNATAQVNDKVTVNTRLTTYNPDGKTTWINMDKADGSVTEVRFDHYNVKYADKNLIAIVGRDDAFLGKGTIIDDNLLGAQLVVPFGNEKQYTFAAISGRLDDDDTTLGVGNDVLEADDLNLTAFELNGKIGKVGVGFDYGWIEVKDDAFSFDKNVLDEDKANVFGVNLDYTFNDKVNVWAEYVKSDIELNAANGQEKDDDAIVVGVNYQAHPRLGFDVAYGRIGGASVVPGISTWSDGLDNDNFYGAEKADMWKVGVNYDLMKNVKLYAKYWNVSCDGNTVDDQDKDYQRIETGLNFKF